MNFKFKYIPLLFGSTVFFASNAFALPDYKATSDALAAIHHAAGSTPSLTGVAILKDDSSQTIYVGPSSRKVQTGEFSPTADANHCEMLENLFAVTYMVPNADPSEWPAIAKRGSVSPFFDRDYGNYEYYSSLIRMTADAEAAELKYQQKYPHEFGAYSAAKDLFEARNGAVDGVQAQLNALTSSVTSAITILSTAQTANELNAAKATLQAASEQAATQSPALREQLRTAVLAREAARGPYMSALATWAPYMAQATDLAKRVKELNDVLTTVNEMADNAFAAAQGTLTREENRLVGFASVTYSLFGGEVDAVRALPSAAHVPVNPLPVYDVTLGSTIARGNVESDELGVNLVNYSTPVGPYESHLMQSPFYLLLPGWDHARPIETPVRAATQGTQTLRAPISRGAYCMGGAPAQKRFNRSGNDGRLGAFTQLLFHPRTNPVFTDSVGLHYKFAVKAEPTAVTCSLDFASLDDFARSAGEVKGFLYERSWDDTTRKAVKNKGIQCHVTNLVPSSDSENRQAKLDELAQQYSQDIAAEFILMYGKSWTIATGEPSKVPDHNPSNGLGHAGASMQALCGGNMYCQITGLVMKTIDEIFGSTSGSTSHRDTFATHLSRDYSLTTWRQVDADSVIDLEVRAPQ